MLSLHVSDLNFTLTTYSSYSIVSFLSVLAKYSSDFTHNCGFKLRYLKINKFKILK
jgi:hypothetical protein